jgi:hypothetical protein
MKSSSSFPRSAFRRSAITRAIGLAQGSQSGLRRVMRLSVPAVTGALFCLPVFAQDGAAADTAPTSAPQKVIVTGSMLARTNAETAEAISVITADSLKSQGVTTVEQALQRVSSNQTAQVTAAPRSAVRRWFLAGRPARPGRRQDADPAGRTTPREQRLFRRRGRPEPHPVRRDRPDRSAARRRVVDLRRGRDRGRDQLHHEEGLPRRRARPVGLAFAGHGGNTQRQPDLRQGFAERRRLQRLASANFNAPGELRGYERGSPRATTRTSAWQSAIRPMGTWPGNYVDANGNIVPGQRRRLLRATRSRPPTSASATTCTPTRST